MLKAYAMALAVSTTAPAVDKEKQESVQAPAKQIETKTVLVDTTKTNYFWEKMFGNSATKGPRKKKVFRR